MSTSSKDIKTGGLKTARRSATTTHEKLWVDGIKDEQKFWAKWAEDGREKWFAQARPMKLELRCMLPIWTEQTEVLDVGAGAISGVGRDVNGTIIKVVQADPLAEWYQHIVKNQPNEVHSVGGEKLQEYFGERRFDLVCAHNSVDHSAAPDKVLAGMAAVTKGPVYLEHIQNVALVNRWQGLHQWNFDVRKGRVCIWSKDRQFVDGMPEPYDVAECLGTSAWHYDFGKAGVHPTIRFRAWL